MNYLNICATFVTILHFAQNIYSQDTVNYTFIRKSKTIRDTNEVSLIKHSEFQYNRIYYNDTIFEERFLFNADSSMHYIFMKRGSKWYMKTKTGWDLFFNDGEKVKCKFVTPPKNSTA